MFTPCLSQNEGYTLLTFASPLCLHSKFLWHIYYFNAYYSFMQLIYGHNWRIKSFTMSVAHIFQAVIPYFWVCKYFFKDIKVLNGYLHHLNPLYLYLECCHPLPKFSQYTQDYAIVRNTLWIILSGTLIEVWNVTFESRLRAVSFDCH